MTEEICPVELNYVEKGGFNCKKINIQTIIDEIKIEVKTYTNGVSYLSIDANEIPGTMVDTVDGKLFKSKMLFRNETKKFNRKIKKRGKSK